MEMEGSHFVWTEYGGWRGIGFFGSCCVGLKRGRRSAEWIGILVPPVGNKFRGGVCFGLWCGRTYSGYVGKIRRQSNGAGRNRESH